MTARGQERHGTGQGMSERVEILGLMRFNVVLSSAAKWGWKATQGRSVEEIAALILDPKRIETRLRLARALPIASLAQQTDRDFTLYMMVSSLLPATLKAQLAELEAEFPFIRVVELDPSASLRGTISSLIPAGRPCITFRLDDDDAVGPHHVADLRSMAVTDNEESVLSFPEGVYMAREGGKLTFQQVHYPTNAYGIAFYSRVGASIFDQRNHAKLSEGKMRTNPRPNAWIRSLHADSDSDTRLRSGVRTWSVVPARIVPGLPEYDGLDFVTVANDLAPFTRTGNVGQAFMRVVRRVLR